MTGEEKPDPPPPARLGILRPQGLAALAFLAFLGFAGPAFGMKGTGGPDFRRLAVLGAVAVAVPLVAGRFPKTRFFARTVWLCLAVAAGFGLLCGGACLFALREIR